MLRYGPSQCRGSSPGGRWNHWLTSWFSKMLNTLIVVNPLPMSNIAIETTLVLCSKLSSWPSRAARISCRGWLYLGSKPMRMQSLASVVGTCWNLPHQPKKGTVIPSRLINTFEAMLWYFFRVPDSGVTKRSGE